MRQAKLANKLVKEKDISLKIFNKLLLKKFKTDVEKSAFKSATKLLIKLMKEEDLPRYVKNIQHLQQMINGKYYISIGENGFDILSNQNKVRYGGIIYVIKCVESLIRFQDISEEIYVGRTWKSKFGRFIDHISDAIKSYMRNFEMPNRLIECAILTAIEDYLRNKYKYDSTIRPLDDFINKIYKKNEWQIRQALKNIAKEIYSDYFTMKVLEVHRNYETTQDREVWWIKNYSRLIGDKIVRGTLSPNGLNMIDFPTRLGHKSLPMYDIVFLISLGYDGPNIYKMLDKY